jgi:hypothetical protein
MIDMKLEAEMIVVSTQTLVWMTMGKRRRGWFFIQESVEAILICFGNKILKTKI